MRITCPNCGARYEVDEAMIPAEGRDVQCSNCTTTWFQPGGVQGDDDDIADAPPPEPPVAHREPTRPITPEPQTPRRAVDPEVRDVLREEAEREAALRRQEAEQLEVQDEMPLDAPGFEEPEEELDDVGAAISGLMADAEDIGELQDAPRERAASDAAARYEGAAPPAAAAPPEASVSSTVDGGAGSRRDLLPDIEEINSTLRASDGRSAGAVGGSDIGTVEGRPRRRRGTRLGFALAILIFAGLVAVYANAARIAEMVPQAGPVLQGYVAQVDRLRGWIDEIAQGALTADEGGAETQTPPAPEPVQAPVEPEAEAAETPETEGAAETPAPDVDAAEAEAPEAAAPEIEATETDTPDVDAPEVEAPTTDDTGTADN